MANKMFRLGILVVVLVFGMTVIGCGESTGEGFTLTDIPREYRGREFILGVLSPNGTSSDIFAGGLPDPHTGRPNVIKISGRSVSVPLFKMTDGTPQKYTGSDAVLIDFMIMNPERTQGESPVTANNIRLTFSNGNAKISFDDCEVYNR